MTFRGRSATLGVLAAALVFSLCAAANAATGDVDGYTRLKGAPDLFVLQPDGAILGGVDGNGREHNLSKPDVSEIRRYLPDGMVDRRFGGDGLITLRSHATDVWLSQVDTDSEGRVLARVVTRGVPSTDGALDGTKLLRFGPDGEPQDSLHPFGPDWFAEFAIDPQGRLLFLGGDGMVSRRLPDLSPDPSFGNGGYVDTSIDNGRRIAVGPDGAALVAGPGYSGPPDYSFLGRVTAVGDPDASFGGGDGIVMNFFGDPLRFIRVAPTGDIYGAGGDLVRLTPDGDADDTFTTPHLGDPLALTFDDAGRVVYAFRGSPGPGYAATGGVARLSPSGKLDPSFGKGGVTYLYGPDARGFNVDSVLTEADGSVLALGPILARLSPGEGDDDVDGDGFTDARDRCKWLADRGHRQGCPRFEAHLTLQRGSQDGAGRLSGRVRSLSPACKAGAEVRIFRARDGQDRLVGVTTSSTPRSTQWAAVFGINEGLRPGRYYGVIKGHDEGARGYCAPARSDALSFGP